MDEALNDQPQEFGRMSQEQLLLAAEALKELKSFRAEFGKNLCKPAEFFVPNPKLDPASRITTIRKMKFFNQTSHMNALLLRHEYNLKLLSTIDGYIVAVEQTNPLLTYLIARYALELAATVYCVKEDLKSAATIDLRDWEGRGSQFLSVVCRAKYAASDPKVAELLKSIGASTTVIKPINIGNAIKRLAARSEFASAASAYDFLSNICHHNGSAHQLFHRSLRVTDHIVLPTGQAYVTTKPCTAVALEYPPPVACQSSRVQTARLLLGTSQWIEAFIEDMPMAPFSDADFSILTDGESHNSMNYFASIIPEGFASTARPRRNDPCRCGSGKKFKKCCLNSDR